MNHHYELIKINVMSIIYVFANPSFPDFIKIGRCSNLEQRLRSLSSNTALPLPFECIFACRVKDAKSVEATLHRTFDDCRVNPRREFFRMSPEPVIALLQLMSLEEVEVNESLNEEIESSDDAFKETLYSEFTFDQASVPLGETITFTHTESFKCCVVGRNEVEFQGSEYSLTDMTKLALRQIGKDPKIKISPARYWLYNDEPLTHRKHQKLHGRLDD